MASKANLIVDQGASFSATITLRNDEGVLYDLTGFSGRSQMRKHYTSLSPSLSFTVAVNSSLSSVTLSANAEQTSSVTSGRYVYDVELYDNSNNVLRVIEGIVTVTPEVTR